MYVPALSIKRFNLRRFFHSYVEFYILCLFIECGVDIVISFSVFQRVYTSTWLYIDF